MALANLIQMQWSYTQGNWAAYIQQNSIHTWLDWNTIWQTNTLLTPHVSNHFAFFFSFFSINIKRKTENDFQFNAFNPPNVLCFPCIFYELIYEDEKKKQQKSFVLFHLFDHQCQIIVWRWIHWFSMELFMNEKSKWMTDRGQWYRRKKNRFNVLT